MGSERRDGVEVPQEQRQQQLWNSRINSHQPVCSNHPTQDGQGNHDLQNPRQNINTPNTNGANTHRQIIGKYELGGVLATGDFDCRTRLCTDVMTGAPYVVRVYDKHVLAEAQWMWDRVAESIHVLRKLPRNKHILEMVECFESNMSVYILMHLFPSMNLTKLFTDEAARAELLNRLHNIACASTRVSAAARKKRFLSGNKNSNDQESDGDESSVSGTRHASHNSSFTCAATAERTPVRQWKDGRQGSSTFEMLDKEHSQRAAYTGFGEENKSSPCLFPETPSSDTDATTAAIHALEGDVPRHIPLALIRAFFEQVVNGVVFLHQHGVAHTGIAPDHLLVNADGLLRIGNMVSAFFCAPGERVHELRGTMHTVAPEVLRGEAYDPFMADAWALGVVFYFMLNRGRYPHDGANTLRHILHGHTRQTRPGLPAVALDLLSRLMQAKPEDRLPVDAILAHPFFTAALPTVEEEMFADAADELARNHRRSAYTGDYALHQVSSDSHNNKATAYDAKSTNSSNAARAGAGGVQRGGRATGGNADSDPDVPEGLWSTLQQQSRCTISSASSEMNGLLMAEGLSATFCHLDSTTTPSGAGEQLGAISGGGDGGGSRFDLLDDDNALALQCHPPLADGRAPRLPALLYSPATPNHEGFGPTSCVKALGSLCHPNAAERPRPVWRPELAPSIDALGDLAARVIQYHFRAALYRRQYKAETQALMKRGQRMLLCSSSGSRDGSPASPQAAATAAADTNPKRSLLRSHRTSSLAHSTLLNSATAVSPMKQPHPAHRRISALRNPIVSTPPSSLPLPSWKRKPSSHSNHGNAAPGALTSSVSSLRSPHGRWPSSVGYSGTAGGAASASHGRCVSSSVTIDTGVSSFCGDNANEERVERDRRESTEDETIERCSAYMNDGSVGRARVSSSSPREGDSAGVGGEKSFHSGSLALPSLAGRGCGTDWASEATVPQQHLRAQGDGISRISSNMANAPLLSQQGRRRSTISVVFSSAAPARVSVERQRIGGGEVCPLCHREPYATRSISMRPYATTPYQFTGGQFTKLNE
ncbi:hypothetical protein ABL78_1454 [Leptomonas seymouri]|uniref:Protein kinase domain-containing protein n=1 Tax=Leptomonas seymouri TaxID=5684 RepID=A0A0N1I270_LEPSE|nr:hypothetical protein ABL78_1454 [Leptomonas seymouri]|eukprot:KPI89418.1 hypothetical protein ABL78_1454 [Leptomonas seymouri]